MNYYGFIFFIGFLVFYYLVERSKLKRKEEYFVVTILFTIIFARIFHVFSMFDYYSKNLANVFKIWEGGLAWYGGVFGFLLSQLYFIKKENWLEIKKLLNKFILFVPIFIIVGRIANFFNNENKGVGFLFLNQQIFEAIFQGLFVFFIVLFSKDRIKSFILSYLIFRLFTEYFRYPVGFKINHLFFLIVSFLVLFIYRKLENKF